MLALLARFVISRLIISLLQSARNEIMKMEAAIKEDELRKISAVRITFILCLVKILVLFFPSL